MNRGKSLEKSWNKGPVFLVLPPSSQPHHSCVAPLLFPVAASVAIRKCITKISSQVVKLREEKRVSVVSHLPPGRRCYEFSHLLLHSLSSPQPRITISSSRVSTLFATYYILHMYFNTAVTCTSTNSLPKYSRRSFSLPLSVLLFPPPPPPPPPSITKL